MDKEIEASTNQVSPIILVKNNDGTTNVCVDLSQLNNITKRVAVLCLKSAGSKLYYTSNLTSGDYQVQTEKVAFIKQWPHLSDKHQELNVIH